MNVDHARLAQGMPMMLLICAKTDDKVHIAARLSAVFDGPPALAGQRWDIVLAPGLLDQSALPQLEAIVRPAVVLRFDGGAVQVFEWDVARRMCPICLELRSLGLRTDEELYAYRKGREITARSSQFLTDFSCQHLRALVESLASGAKSAALGYTIQLETLDIYSFRLETHSSCPLCRAKAVAGGRPSSISLMSQEKLAFDTYRTRSLSEIPLPLDKYVDPTCGMFGSLVVERRYDSFNAQAIGAFRELNARHGRINWSGHASSFKKSRLVGLCEAFERHSGLRLRGSTPPILGTFSSLQADALDPRTCGLYDSKYYLSDKSLTEFNVDLALQWIWGYSITEDRPILVPMQMVHYGENEVASCFVRENSNGCAAGSCLEEAILHAIFELIERDSFLIHWYAGLAPHRIDPESVSNRDLRFLIARLQRANLDIHLLDTRLDVRIPSVTAILRRRDDDFGAFGLAAGCSFDPETAITSALGELASYQAGFKERTVTLQPSLEEALDDFSLVQTMDQHAALYGLPKAVRLADFLTGSSTMLSVSETYEQWHRDVPKGLDIRDDLLFCLSHLDSCGLKQVIVIEQTSPEQQKVGLRTVRVIVPGMMPLDFGYGRCRPASLSRLYDVPRKLKLRSPDLSPEHLYLAPHPFP